MEKKLRAIHISDVVNKGIMVEMAAHITKASGGKKRKWFAEIVTKDRYENAKKEISGLPNLMVYSSEYEILYTLAHGYLKGLDVIILECAAEAGKAKDGHNIMLMYSAK
ncbi:MAG TPA: hypothetical protein VK806_00840 [Bacteroidia bacterium]|jgi:hypothetical protein|nr:hypothetical protein [Bacteroidia bacterium]